MGVVLGDDEEWNDDVEMVDDDSFRFKEKLILDSDSFYSVCIFKDCFIIYDFI